jgi:hypothetical protein
MGGYRRATPGRTGLADKEQLAWPTDQHTHRPQAPGYMLLRSEADGTCFYLPADDGGRLLQVRPPGTLHPDAPPRCSPHWHAQHHCPHH